MLVVTHPDGELLVAAAALGWTALACFALPEAVVGVALVCFAVTTPAWCLCRRTAGRAPRPAGAG